MVLTVPTVTDVVAVNVVVDIVVVVVVEVLASVLLVVRLPPTVTVEVLSAGVDVETAEDVSELEACLFLLLHGYLWESKYST